jgi:signal peptidase I
MSNFPMSAITAVLYGALVVYLGGWYFDLWFGDLALLLLILSVVTGFYWVAEKLKFKPARAAAARRLEDQLNARSESLAREGLAADAQDLDSAKDELLRQPWWLDWTAGLFPVIIFVFILRSFLFEPFKIPSGSMIPTLQIGDLILVNKFEYGIRLPVIDKKIIPVHDLHRGDVVVFRYPVDPRVDYIKRVVGLPGDEVSYLNAQLKINGQVVPTKALGAQYDEESMRDMLQFSETLGGKEHIIQRRPELLPFNVMAPSNFPHRDMCSYSIEGFVCKVPPGNYFMMGDNRDNSADSRYWGFVPDENIVGRAFFVWMNFRNPSRIGGFH